MTDEARQVDILQGTLSMMILRVLGPGPANGYEIARAIERRSDELLQIEHGSLYPALRRLEARGFIEAEWRVSKTNRQARYYKLTEAGRQQAIVEHSRWCSLAEAITRVMRPA